MEAEAPRARPAPACGVCGGTIDRGLRCYKMGLNTKSQVTATVTVSTSSRLFPAGLAAAAALAPWGLGRRGTWPAQGPSSLGGAYGSGLGPSHAPPGPWGPRVPAVAASAQQTDPF